MRVGRDLVRRSLGVLALGAAALAAADSRAEDAPAPPTVERIALDESAGHVEEALSGWAARYLGVPSASERAQALQRYVALASKKASEPDGWLSDSVARSGAGIKVAAGRRVVLVLPEEFLGGADAAKLAAQFDAAELAVERMTGARPWVEKAAKGDKRPRDRAGRFLIGAQPLPKPASEQTIDAWIASADEGSRGPALVYAVAGACASASVPQAPNRCAQNLGPAVPHVVRDLAVRETAEPAAVAVADAYRKRAKEAFENEWAAGCLPGEWMPADEPLAHVFFLALDAERAANREPMAAMHALFAEPRRESFGAGSRVASWREMGLEPLAAVFAPAALGVFRRAGFLPSGLAFEDMERRVRAEEMCREAESLRGDDATRGAAARQFRAAAQALEGSISADEAVVEALELEEKDDPKKARAAAQKLGLLEGFEFLGPLPETRPKDDVPFAARLMPFAVATAAGRHPFKVKEPVEVSLKWAEVKDPYDRLVERTPWGDKRGITWGGSAVAATKWTKDLARWIRLRPCRSEWSAVAVLADGRVLDPWPDGSVIAPGAKGTDVVLASASRITCSVPWRDARSVDADLAAAAAEKDAVLALRPWAARRVAGALPAVVAALTPLADADLADAMKLLAPYRGGDAAACDAMLARAKDHPAVLAAYLDVCRGTRDPAVIDRLVALATAADAPPDTLIRVQYVMDGALFRKVTEKGADLAALWERGKKWLATVGIAEAEEMRDLHDPGSCFRVLADAKAWGRACIGPAGGNVFRGEGYLPLDLPEAAANAFVAVRWQPVGGGRLTLRGSVTDGKRTKAFSVDTPGSATGGADWAVDVLEIGQVPRGRVVLALEDPCSSGCRIDAIAVGAKPLD
jgi:hypothetical protein